MSGDARQARLERILASRTERLARPGERETGGEVVASIIQATVGDEAVGLPVEWLREIVVRPAVAPLPGAPPWLPGLVQVRGRLMGVVDLARFLGLRTPCRGTYVAIVETPPGPLGILLDDIRGFRTVTREELAERLEETAGGPGWPAVGTTRDLVTILDLEWLARDGRLVAGGGDAAR